MQLLRMFHESQERRGSRRKPGHSLGVLITIGALALSASLSACAQSEDGSRSTRRAIAQSQAIATDFLTTELAMSPETASRLGLEDQLGERVAYALDNHSQAGFERRRLVRIELLQRLRLRPQLPETHPLRRDLAIAETALSDLIKLEQYGYGRFGYDDLRPYEIDPYSGIWIEGPTLLAFRQPINSAEDAAAFIARLRSLSGALEDSRRRLISDRAAGIYLPRLLAEETRMHIQRVAADDSAAFNELIRTFEALTRDLPDLDPNQRQALIGLVRTETEERLRPAYNALAATLTETSDAFSDQVGISALPRGTAMFSDIVNASTGTQIDVSRLHNRHLERTQSLYAALDQILVIEQAPQSEEAIEPILDRGPQAMRERLEWFEQALTPPEQAALEIDETFAAPPPFNDLALGTVWATLADLDEYDAQSEAVQTFDALFDLPPYAGWALEFGLPPYRSVMEYPAIEEGIRLYGWSVLDADTAPLDAIARSRVTLLASSLATIDTGIHLEQWTHSDASQYLEDMVGVPTDLARRLALMVVARPGYHSAVQTALGRISAISERAQAVLGEKYDEREFLRAIFAPGPRPLSLIETDVEDWYAARLEN